MITHLSRFGIEKHFERVTSHMILMSKWTWPETVGSHNMKRFMFLFMILTCSGATYKTAIMFWIEPSKYQSAFVIIGAYAKMNVGQRIHRCRALSFPAQVYVCNAIRNFSLPKQEQGRASKLMTKTPDYRTSNHLESDASKALQPWSINTVLLRLLRYFAGA